MLILANSCKISFANITNKLFSYRISKIKKEQINIIQINLDNIYLLFTS